MRCIQSSTVSPLFLVSMLTINPTACHTCIGAPGATSQCLQPCWGRPRRCAERNRVVFATSWGGWRNLAVAAALQSNHVHACGRQVAPLPCNANAMRAIIKAGHQPCTSCNSEVLMLCMMSDMIPMLVLNDDVTLKQQHQLSRRAHPQTRSGPHPPPHSDSLPLARLAVGLAT